MNAVRVEHLCKSFGNLTVLKDMNLTVESGERIAVIGPSGCGKSVFLRSLNLLETPDSGHIFIGDEEITAPEAEVNRIRKSMGMVYQGFHLFEHLNVIDNITLAPRKLGGIPRHQAEEEATELLRMVGLESKKYEMPDVLSGGQKQRIAIARCLAMKPKVMLFDEPTSALDPTMTGEVLATIRMLAKRDLTMLIVTHEMNFAREVASRVLFFEEHGIYEEGTPQQIFDAPQKEKTRTFIRKLKFFSQQINTWSFDLMRLHGGISTFSERYGIGGKAAYRLQLCTEELIYELLNGCYGPKNAASVDLNISIEYSEAEKRAKLLCDCGGKAYNPFEARLSKEEPLGITIIRRTAERSSYSFETGRNRFEIEFNGRGEK